MKLDSSEKNLFRTATCRPSHANMQDFPGFGRVGILPTVLFTTFSAESKLRLIIVLVFFIVSGYAGAQMLNEDQIRDLQTKWLDTSKNKTILFYGGFTQRSLSSERDRSLINVYKRNGKVPFRLWAECGEIWELKSGRKSSELYSLGAYFYIMDEKGAVVLQKQRNILEMQNNKGLGGYFGDLPKEGTYTCVIWVNKSGMLFGKKMTATFTGYQ